MRLSVFNFEMKLKFVGLKCNKRRKSGIREYWYKGIMGKWNKGIVEY